MCRIVHINTYHFNELLSSVLTVFSSSAKKLPNKSPNTSHVKHFFDFLARVIQKDSQTYHPLLLLWLMPEEEG